MKQRIITVKEKAAQIRAPKQYSRKKALLGSAAVFVAGVLLGIVSKWLDNIAIDDTITWHRIIERLDLGNFFSDIAVWLLIALAIAVFSYSASLAVLNVFLFFTGMCAAYHIYTIVFSGFDPTSYMMIWYGLTLLSPILAVLCWYAKGMSKISVVLDIMIMAVLFLACFSIGWFYISVRGILYVLVFAVSVIILYTSPKQIIAALTVGFLTALFVSPVWIYL